MPNTALISPRNLRACAVLPTRSSSSMAMTTRAPLNLVRWSLAISARSFRKSPTSSGNVRGTNRVLVEPLQPPSDGRRQEHDREGGRDEPFQSPPGLASQPACAPGIDEHTCVRRLSVELQITLAHLAEECEEEVLGGVVGGCLDEHRQVGARPRPRRARTQQRGLPVPLGPQTAMVPPSSWSIFCRNRRSALLATTYFASWTSRNPSWFSTCNKESRSGPSM